MSFGFLLRRPEASGRFPLPFLSFLALSTLLLAGLAATAWAVNPTTVLVTRGSDGGPTATRAFSQQAVISADSVWVAFLSNARNLTPFPPSTVSPNNLVDRYIFAKNTATGAVEAVTVGADGKLANSNSNNPSISADGRYVAFESDGGGILVRDLSTDTTRVASLTAGGAPPNGYSYAPSISADGRYVAFESIGTNLVPDDTNGASDLFVRDLVADTTTLVSAGPDGTQTDIPSHSASISADGRYVAFVAATLLPDDTTGFQNIYIRDMTTGALTRASVGTGGFQENGHSFAPSMSADGRYVAFYSNASTLVASDTNNARDVFVRDLVAGVTTLVSLGPGGVQANNHSDAPSLSADGRYVAFSSLASNLVVGDTNGRQALFVRDLSTGTTTRVSVNSSDVQANGDSFRPSISGEGRYVAFDSYANNLAAGDPTREADIFVRDRTAGVTTWASVGPDGEAPTTISTSGGAAVSADGRYVAFHSDASNLVAGDTNGIEDIFVRDLATGALTWVTAGADGVSGPPINRDPTPSLSADGRYVAFDSGATNLIPGDTNGFLDVFVKDLVTGTITRASVGAGGTQANGGSASASISADGRYVAFQSGAGNLTPRDSKEHSDIFVRDLVAGTTIRASAGVGGVEANLGSYYPAISADGRYVAFASDAYNLVPDDTSNRDVFVRDLAAGVTTRVSVGPGGVQANGNSDRPSVSADGRYVAFTSAASNLVPGDTNNAWDIFVRDLVTGANTKVSAGVNGAQANNYSFNPSISTDGRYVAFESDASNLVPDDTNNKRDLFVRDRSTGVTTRVSVNSSGAQADDRSTEASISANGRVIAYLSTATNLTNDVTNGSTNVFVTTLPAPMPGAPTNLTAVAITSRRVNLAWTDHATNETGFELWASLDGAPFSQLTTLPANQTTYQHLGPEGSHTLHYRIRAVTTGAQTDFSNIATGILMAQPLGLTAKALNSTTVDVRWKDNATNEGKYEVWRAMGGGAFTLLATKNPGATQHTDSVPAGNQSYSYKVCGRNGVHLSSFSNQDPAVTLLAPTNLAVQATGTQVKLTWTDNSGALETGFQIYRRTSAPRSQTLVGTTAANATSFTDPTAGVGQSYWYEVRAMAGTDYSSFTSLAPVLPLQAPVPFTAKALNSTTVDLRWKDNATNETNYEIWRSVDGGPLRLHFTTPFPNATQYTDTVPAGDAVYTYQVRAKSGANYSYFTNQDGATTLRAPTNLNATPVSSTQVDLTWTDNSGLETGFQLFRRSSTQTSWGLKATVGANSTSYSDSTAQGGTAYSYLVRAVTDDNGSSYTNQVQVNTPQ